MSITSKIGGWLAAALFILFATPSAHATTVRGTFRYLDTTAPTPIRFARVEIWQRGVFIWDFWTRVGIATTDGNGFMSFSDTRSNGTYAVRVFAVNYAASVWPNNAIHFDPFFAEPGNPGVSFNLQSTSVSSLLDFSFNFTNTWIAQHYNLAETARLGFDYVSARRDPNETDPLPRVWIEPTPFSISPTVTFYNAPADTLVIKDSDSFQDFLVLHEYGHFVEEQISNFAMIPTYHDGCRTSTWAGGPLLNSAEHAWMEGFASYFAASVARTLPVGTLGGSAGFGTFPASRLETPPACAIVGTPDAFGNTITAAMIEDLVSASLFDTFDPLGSPAQGVESHDGLAAEDVAVIQILDRELDMGRWPNIFDFRNAWIGRGKDVARLDCILAFHGILGATAGCGASGPVKLAGDFNGDGKTDIALTGAPGWSKVPVAFSNGNGTFNVTNTPMPLAFYSWAAEPGAAKLIGDFNGDGKADIALTGRDWGAVPIAFSQGTGYFDVQSWTIAGGFDVLSMNREAEKLTGDFNGDGKTDIALIGPPEWGSIPIAFSVGDGNFNVTNVTISNFASWASDLHATKLTGDFNHDGRTDIALVGPASWTTLPVAFSNGNGSFYVTNMPISNFAAWASDPLAQKLTGDFNGDGYTDIALTGPAWGSVPVAFSNGGGGFNVTNNWAGSFGSWSSDFRATRLVGDFSGDGKADIALTGVPGWTTVPLAISIGTAGFNVTNGQVGSFGPWSSTPGVSRLVGDFNGDGKKDIALTGPSGWLSIPIAFSTGGGLFNVTNSWIGDFAIWSSLP